MLSVSIVIPAYNEERLLPFTLAAVNRAQAELAEAGGSSEVVLVNNRSTDRTAAIGRQYGAQVLWCRAQSIAGARNKGGSASSGDILLFLDADTLVPKEILVGLATLMSDSNVFGGAFAARIVPARRSLKPYLAMWRWLAERYRMAQGIAQFVRREAFDLTGGFDERLVMAEDIEFYWRLQRVAECENKRVEFNSRYSVTPSARRLDAWPVWKTVLKTSPLVVVPLRVPRLQSILRSSWLWREWYDQTVR